LPFFAVRERIPGESWVRDAACGNPRQRATVSDKGVELRKTELVVP
jgi:hypothetical protein